MITKLKQALNTATQSMYKDLQYNHNVNIAIIKNKAMSKGLDELYGKLCGYRKNNK